MKKLLLLLLLIPNLVMAEQQVNIQPYDGLLDWFLWFTFNFFIVKIFIAGYKGWWFNKPTLYPKIYPVHNGRIYFAFVFFASLIGPWVSAFNYGVGETIFRVLMTLPACIVAFFVGYFITYVKKDNHALSKEDYAEALNEFENNRDEQLWTKHFAESDGDESKAKARYLKDRAKILSTEDKSQLDSKPTLNKLSDEEREKMYQSLQDYKDGKL